MPIFILVINVAILLCTPIFVWADGGELMVYPTRIVFEKNRRSAQIELTNTGTGTVNYKLSLQNKRMNEVGQFSFAESPRAGELFADHLIQFSPKNIEIPPGGGQVVRLILRKPANLEIGEYRSHLVFNRQPDIKQKKMEEENQASGKEISISITALIGLSIPIIVENGATTVTGAISSLKILSAAGEKAPLLKLKLERSGNRSLYGDLTIKYKNSGGKELLINESKGLAIYSPNPFRMIEIPLPPDKTGPLKKGTLEASFRETKEAGGKLLAQNTLEVP